MKFSDLKIKIFIIVFILAAAAVIAGSLLAQEEESKDPILVKGDRVEYL